MRVSGVCWSRFLRVRAAAFAASVVLTACAVAACGHSPNSAKAAHEGRGSGGGGAAPQPAQYLVADPGPRSNVVALPLHGGSSLGLVVDKTRIVIDQGEPKVGQDLPEQPLTGVARIPARMKGGFLFWTDSVVYRAASFDGKLEPVVRLEDIEALSFGPKFLLVRTRNGERWALSLPSGERAAIEPLGVVDIEALDDGRTVAFTDQGIVYTSMDAGTHWTDITASVKTPPERVRAVDDELWLVESGGGALRLEPDGQLAHFDKPPPEKTHEMRPKDPRWRGGETPLRAVFHGGALVDEHTGIVIEQGDVATVDLQTGQIGSYVAGKLPPEARCEAVVAANDILFACASRGTAAGGYANPASFVVSGALAGAPVIEQTFGSAGHFFASDDGGLAFAGPCTGTATGAADQSVCVRQPGGSWQDFDLALFAGDASVGASVNVARWIPRADGRVVALVVEPQVAIFDPKTGALEALDDAARDSIGQGAGSHGARFRRHGISFDGSALVDSTWSYTPSGTLRGWSRGGGILEIGTEGKVTRSPYSFELVTSGPHALGRSKEGRLFQSADHGATWVEVLAPPSGASAGELRTCSAAGCDLGGFYRIGWEARAPRPEPVLTPAKPAPDVRRTRATELACRPTGAVQLKSVRRTDASPEDLGLGATKLPTASEQRTDIGFLRSAVPRAIVNPLHDAPFGDSDNPAMRAMFTGFLATRDAGDVIEVAGPNKSASALRRGFQFVPPFDPAGNVRKATIAMSEVLAVGRLAGMTTDEILADDMTDSGAVFPMTPIDPNAASDLGIHNARGLLSFVRSNERVRVGMRPNQNSESSVVSGVALSGDEAAFLEIDTGTGVEHVFKMGAGGGLADLFDLRSTSTNTTFYPANPDALAVGPRNDLGVIQTMSGSDPPSANDPALLFVSAAPVVALAPWSSLRLSDDPACKEPGWRATLQVIAPWVRVTSPELRVEEMPMLARVKWNEKRVCLEGVEVKLPDVTVRIPGASGGEAIKVASWLVSRGGTFARIAVGEGVEWRQALECSLTSAPPAANNVLPAPPPPRAP